MNKQVEKMHQRRKAIEQLEITVYLIKHNPPADNKLEEHLTWIKEELAKYRKALNRYDAPYSKDYAFLLGEIKRVKKIIKERSKKMEKDKIIMTVKVCDDNQLSVSFEGRESDIHQVLRLLVSMYGFAAAKNSACPKFQLSRVMVDVSEAFADGIADAKHKLLEEGNALD